MPRITLRIRYLTFEASRALLALAAAARMTREEHRKACIEVQAKARWRLDCLEAEEEYRRDGRAIPEKWADPWDESDCGLHQQRKYIREATLIFDALHGIARVDPVEATEKMIMAACATPSEIEDRVDCWRIMSAAGDLTNPPEL